MLHSQREPCRNCVASRTSAGKPWPTKAVLTASLNSFTLAHSLCSCIHSAPYALCTCVRAAHSPLYFPLMELSQLTLHFKFCATSLLLSTHSPLHSMILESTRIPGMLFQNCGAPQNSGNWNEAALRTEPNALPSPQRVSLAQRHC